MMSEETLIIDPAHPSLAGHFPGRPIVPGAVLLDHAIDFAAKTTGRRIAGVLSAKFRSPLVPGTACQLRLAERSNGAIEVTCTAAGVTVLTALLDTD